MFKQKTYRYLEKLGLKQSGASSGQATSLKNLFKGTPLQVVPRNWLHQLVRRKNGRFGSRDVPYTEAALVLSEIVNLHRYGYVKDQVLRYKNGLQDLAAKLNLSKDEVKRALIFLSGQEFFKLALRGRGEKKPAEVEGRMTYRPIRAASRISVTAGPA